MKIPKIIHIVWLGKNTHPYVPFYKKWAELHPDWQIMFWNDEYIPTSKNKDVIKSRKHFSSKSNIVRLEVVEKYGGVYVDTDVEPIKNLEPLLENIEAFVGYQLVNEKVCNAVFGATPHHPWLKTLLETLPAYQEQEPPWGSVHMGEALKKHRDVTIFQPEVFYPFLWDEPQKSRGPFGEKTYARHLWARSWKQFKNVIPI